VNDSESSFAGASATRRHIADLSIAEREAWRLADVSRPSADERNLPHEFPFGWYIVAYSDEVQPGDVVPLRYFGQELVLWRGEDGLARVLDAYGAHMGHGGKVHGNWLECPFHAFSQFYASSGPSAEAAA
jgi:hypothetical protein